VSQDELKLFVHVEGTKSEVASAAPGETLREVMRRARALRDDQSDVHVFVGQCDDALREAEEVEDGTDDHAPVDTDLTLQALDLARHRHVHCHRCRHAAVEVKFTKTKRHRFSPATTIDVVTAWARKKFKIDPAIAGEYVLQICGTRTQPRPGEHLSELVHAPDCLLCFDLVKEITPAG
jgi:hypothetical protein